MKLGLILKNTNTGESETYSINKHEVWARYASDTRSAIKELQGFDGSDKTVFLLKFLGGIGYLLSVIKSRPEGSGRVNDNSAAWIFVPSAAIVSANEMEQVLKQVEEAISESKGVDYAKLKETFSKDYNIKKVLVSAVGTISSSADGNYALRYYNGDYRLNELLGEHLAQPEYARFKGVFLVEKNSGIKLSTNDVLDFEPKQSITISPLKSVGGFVAGFPTAKGFMKFDRDIELAIGQKITIEWRRDNYAPIVKTFTAGVDSTANLEIEDTERQVRLHRSWFKVLDSHGISIKNANVSINHQLITGEYLDVAESLLFNNGTSVTIQADGYEEYHEVLQEITPKKVIKMHHRVYELEYIVPIYDGERRIGEGKLIFSTKQKINSSPLKGYEIQDHKYLEYSVGFISKIKTFVYGFVSCLLIFLFWAGIQVMDIYELQFGWPPFKLVVQHEPAEGVIEDVSNDSVKIGYLDDNKSWNKDSLDRHEETIGLFEELNKFNLETLKKRIAEKKLSSKNLQKVVDALQKNQDEGFNPHVGKSSNGGNYNSMSDKNINIDNYIKWLSVNHASNDAIQSEDLSSSIPSQMTESSKITGKTKTPKESKGENKQSLTNKSDSKTGRPKSDSKVSGGVTSRESKRGEVK